MVGAGTENNSGGDPLSHIWEYLKDHDSEITGIKTDIAELRVGQQNTISKIDTLAISTGRIEQYLHRAPEKPNYSNWIMAFVAVSAIIGSLFLAFVGPLQKDNDYLMAWKDRHMEQKAKDDEAKAYKSGKIDQRLEDVEKLENRQTEREAHLDELDHKRDDILILLREGLAEERMKGLAIGNYAKETRAKVESRDTAGPVDRQK